MAYKQEFSDTLIHVQPLSLAQKRQTMEEKAWKEGKEGVGGSYLSSRMLAWHTQELAFKLHYQKGRRRARKIRSLQKIGTQGCKTHAHGEAATRGKQLILFCCPQHGKDMRCVMELL